ncbi:MAG: hypothetical protein KDD44_07280 [Bdellovibrionales bacterium]|nr:hypothetical protein [Bdellovibrionales bacterium]
MIRFALPILFAVSATALYVLSPLVDPDLWWHLVVGRWVLAHHEAPRVDHWNALAAGREWISYSWAAEVLFARVEQAGGFLGLFFLKALLCVLLVASLFGCYWSRARDWLTAALLSLVVLAGVAPALMLRPQTIAFILLVWLLYALSLVRERLEAGALGPALRASVLALFVIVVWSNVHVSAVLAPGIVFCWLMGRSNVRGSWPVPLVAAGVCGGATLINPHGLGLYRASFDSALHPMLYQAILEFSPLTIFQPGAGMLLVLLVWMAVVFLSRPEHAERFRILLMGGFTVLALTAVKFLPLASLIAGAVLADLWGNAHGERAYFGMFGRQVARLEGQLHGVRWGLVTSVLGMLCAVLLVGRLQQPPALLARIPESAWDYVEQHNLQPPLLNRFGDGGYLMFRTADENGVPAKWRVAVDGRTTVLTPEEFADYYALELGLPNWRTFVQRVQPRTIVWKVDTPLFSVLEADPAWTLVYDERSDSSRRVGERWAVFVPVGKTYPRKEGPVTPSENLDR